MNDSCYSNLVYQMPVFISVLVFDGREFSLKGVNIATSNYTHHSNSFILGRRFLSHRCIEEMARL
jgi:hypothetical protein